MLLIGVWDVKLSSSCPDRSCLHDTPMLPKRVVLGREDGIQNEMLELAGPPLSCVTSGRSLSRFPICDIGIVCYDKIVRVGRLVNCQLPNKRQ